MNWIAFFLISFGLLALIFGLFRGRTINRVHADQGSVAVGLNNHAPITVTTTKSSRKRQSLFWIVWNIVTGLATLLGLVLTIWPSK